MQLGEHDFQPDLGGLGTDDWMFQFRALGVDHGFHQSLGALHAASFVDAGNTLLISFESVPRLRNQADGMPLAFDIRRRLGWSGLSLVSIGDTWFRSAAVGRFFEQMRNDGFMSEFDRVVLAGEGPGGYAACTYARAIPGARVLALAPQATLDPRIAGWDRRFTAMRRVGFDGAFGYAPDGLQQTAAAHILYDPHQWPDAMHAALFGHARARHHLMRHMGASPLQALRQMRVLAPTLRAVADDTLTDLRFAQLLRARRRTPAYLRGLLAYLDRKGRIGLGVKMCQSVLKTQERPALRRWLEAHI